MALRNKIGQGSTNRCGPSDIVSVAKPLYGPAQIHEAPRLIGGQDPFRRIGRRRDPVSQRYDHRIANRVITELGLAGLPATIASAAT